MKTVYIYADLLSYPKCLLCALVYNSYVYNINLSLVSMFTTARIYADLRNTKLHTQIIVQGFKVSKVSRFY